MSIFHCHVSLPEGNSPGNKFLYATWGKGKSSTQKYLIKKGICGRSQQNILDAFGREGKKSKRRFFDKKVERNQTVVASHFLGGHFLIPKKIRETVFPF